MNDELSRHPRLILTHARHELRDALLNALVADNSSDSFTAWEQVDLAAVALVEARKKYKRYVRRVVKNLQ
jgi:hypothetical protein